MISSFSPVRVLTIGALLIGSLLVAIPTAQAQLIGTFGAPYKPFTGVMTFRAEGIGAVPSITIDTQPVIDRAWTTARPKLATLIQNELGKGGRFRGQTAYNINVQLAAKGTLQAAPAGNRLDVKYILQGNSITAKMTTPTIFGSYADPKFTVDFDVEVVLKMGRLANGRFGVLSADASIQNARLRGRNVTGTVGLAIGDVVGAFGGPDLRRMAQNSLNAQSLSQPLNVALAPVSFTGDILFSREVGFSRNAGGVAVRFVRPTKAGEFNPR